MVNLTPDGIVYGCDGADLDHAVRAALRTAGDTLLSIHGLTGISMDSVTSKMNARAAFAKFVEGRILARPGLLGRDYVEAAMRFYRTKLGTYTREIFAPVFFSDDTGPYAYKSTFAHVSKMPVGLFLIALHSSGAVTLPVGFDWPTARYDAEPGSGTKWGRRREVGKLVSSELLAFLRGLDSQSEEHQAAFAAVGGDKKRREWFLTYGTKLLLATGWHRAEDVNVEDLAAIKAVDDGRIPLAYKALLEVLKAEFGSRISITYEAWTGSLRNVRALKPREAIPLPERSKAPTDGRQRNAVEDLLRETLQIEPDWARSENLRGLSTLPGLSVDLKSLSSTWLDLEDLYMEKTKRESYRPILTSFKYWNLYLFYYLPYWFGLNPDSKLEFPRTPAVLLTSVFVSRLLPSGDVRPNTFIEFMNAQCAEREWTPNSFYANLLQLEGFFGFIERYADEMPGCDGFRQPLAPHDYPRTSRPTNTLKRPIPRRLFTAYLDFHEALLAHHEVVTARILAGEMSAAAIKKLEKNIAVVDTIATADVVGFVPILFTESRTIRLQFIPNVLDLKLRKIRDGRRLLLPHPHGLRQNLVALHTGIRHNHIQWLDRDKFDSRVDDEDAEFVQLYVNTDKKKTEPWTPHVHRRVIELLRGQKDWVELIDEDGFDAMHFYNNNPNTKWPRFRPLFACVFGGLPHSDNTYTDTWQATLMGLQGLVSELGHSGRSKHLLTLLPPNITPSDVDLAKRLVEYGGRFGMGETCALRPWTLSTPHSARVAVVSQYVTFLPTDMIGNFITGQKPATVSYYVKLDAEAIQTEQVHQAMRLRQAAMRSGFEPVLAADSPKSGSIHADAVNSHLAQAMREDVDGMLIRFGGMSIMFSDRDVTGVDVLRETKGANVAFNKTEICPYGNECPREIIKERKGLRKCSLCPYAVRTVDHLPAVIAKERQVAELVDELETLLAQDASTLDARYTPEELDDIEARRVGLCEELTGWVLSEELLEAKRLQLIAGQGGREWLVRSPEILERGLQLVSTPVSDTEYLLLRLGDCSAYPSLETPQIRARFDLLRRELLARAGDLRSAFDRHVPISPAAECAGLLRAIVESTGQSMQELAAMLDQDSHLTQLPHVTPRVLGFEDAT